MRDISEIWTELRQHPDFLECVIWTREDVAIHVDELREEGVIVTASVDDIMERIDMRGWENVAIEIGWEVIYTAVSEYGEIVYEEDNND